MGHVSTTERRWIRIGPVLLKFATRVEELIGLMEQHPRSVGRQPRPVTAAAFVVVWFAILCLVPDPRPLSAPELAISTVRSLMGFSESTSRAVASIALRAVGFGLLGALSATAVAGVQMRGVLPLGVLIAPALAVVSQWVNYGAFPVVAQLKVSIPSAVAGALVGFALHRSRPALVALAAVVVGLYVWGTSTRLSDDLDAVAAVTVAHILSHEGDIRAGDDGFSDAVFLAFAFAEDNSHRTDPVLSNKAAILASGIIFGDEKVAKVARREMDPEWQKPIGRLRKRVTLRDRQDSPRHFWVSAALTVIADESRATTVGLGKELMDANPGGSGFSFADLAANRAGILFALAATRNAESATAVQMSIIQDGLQSDDFCPDISDLPEGLTRDEFQTTYGGLAGQQTKTLQTEIDRRMATKAILQGNH